MKKSLSLLFAIGASLIVTACSWDTYTKEDGRTGLRPSNAFGQAVYYEDGTYSRNQRYNEHRPIRRVLEEPTVQSEERIRWQQ